MANGDGNRLAAIFSGLGEGRCTFKGRALKLNDVESALKVINEMDQCDQMNVFELEGNTMGIEASEVIAKSLEQRSELKRLLWSDMFTGRLKTEIPPILQNLLGAVSLSGAHLTELDMSDNAFGPNGVSGFQDFLKTPSFFTVKTFKLNNCGLGVTGAKMMAEALHEGLRLSRAAGVPLGLVTFVAGRNRLEDEGSIALAKVFAMMGTLENISITQNGINHRGISAWASAFTKCPRMTSINFTDNTFTAVGSFAMAKAIPSMPALRDIIFDDCLVKTKGAQAILRALVNSHPDLEVLRLNGNDISKSVLPQLREALVNKKHLKNFSLGGNQLGESGIAILEDILRASGSGLSLEPISDDEGSGDEEDSAAEDGELEEEEESYTVSDDEDDDHGIRLPEPECDQVAGGRGSGDYHHPPTPAFGFGFGQSIHQDLYHHNHDQQFPVSSAEQLGARTIPVIGMLDPLHPQLDLLCRLGAQAPIAVLNAVGDEIDNADYVVKVLVGLASLVTRKNAASSRVIISQCCRDLMRRFQSSGDTTSFVGFNNALWAQVGFLKCEEKVETPCNLHGVLEILLALVDAREFHSSTVQSIKFMISMEKEKPNSKLEGNMEMADQLMRSVEHSPAGCD